MYRVCCSCPVALFCKSNPSGFDGLTVEKDSDSYLVLFHRASGTGIRVPRGCEAYKNQILRDEAISLSPKQVTVVYE